MKIPRNVVVSKCDIFIDPVWPWLAAIADLLISCSCCKWVAEFKSPMIWKCSECTYSCNSQLPAYLNFLPFNCLWITTIHIFCSSTRNYFDDICINELLFDLNIFSEVTLFLKLKLEKWQNVWVLKEMMNQWRLTVVNNSLVPAPATAFSLCFGVR